MLLDIASYQDMQNAFSLLKILQLSEKQIEKGKCKKADQVFGDIEKHLGINE